MDLKQSPQSPMRPGVNQPESDEENAYSEDDSVGENGENGSRPRKRQRRPMSVS